VCVLSGGKFLPTISRSQRVTSGGSFRLWLFAHHSVQLFFCLADPAASADALSGSTAGSCYVVVLSRGDRCFDQFAEADESGVGRASPAAKHGLDATYFFFGFGGRRSRSGQFGSSVRASFINAWALATSSGFSAARSLVSPTSVFRS